MAPSDGAASAGAPRTRLIITHMTLENFKSYAGVQQIGPFHKVSARRVGSRAAPARNATLPVVSGRLLFHASPCLRLLLLPDPRRRHARWRGRTVCCRAGTRARGARAVCIVCMSWCMHGSHVRPWLWGHLRGLL